MLMKPYQFLFAILFIPGLNTALVQDKPWYKSLKYSIGLSAANRFYNIRSITFPTYVNKKETGLSYGLHVQCSYQKWVLKTGLIYTAQDFDMKDPLLPGVYLGTPVTRKSMAYLDIPVTLSYRIPVHQNWQLGVSGGFIKGYLKKGQDVITGIYAKELAAYYPGLIKIEPQFRQRVNSICLGTSVIYTPLKRVSLELGAMYRAYDVIDERYALTVSTSSGNKTFYHKYWNAVFELQYRLN